MRKNPYTFKYPDLFTSESRAWEDWRTLSDRQILKFNIDSFEADELEEIQTERPDLYKQLEEADEEAQRKRLEPFVTEINQRAQSQLEYELSEDFAEWYFDAFADWLEGQPEEAIRAVEAAIEDSLEGYEVEEVVFNPDFWEFNSGTEPPYYRDETSVFRQQVSDEIQVYGGDDLLDNLQTLSNRDLEQLKRELEQNDIYVYDRIWPNIKDRDYLEEDFAALNQEVWYWMTPKTDEMIEEMGAVFKGQKRIRRDESEQDVVYKFDNGNYVADLRPDQLPNEGRMQRHCVGRPAYGYSRAVRTGTNKIFSLRNANTKAILTLQVIIDEDRPIKVAQVKGLYNRLPGFKNKDVKEITEISEVEQVVEFIENYLQLDPYSVADLQPALAAIGEQGSAMLDSLEIEALQEEEVPEPLEIPRRRRNPGRVSYPVPISAQKLARRLLATTGF